MTFCRPLIIASSVLFSVATVQADTHAANQNDQVREYRAALRAVNPEYVAGGGRFEMVLDGDQLHIAMTVENLTPQMMHMQHLHGSRDGMGASCPPLSREALNGEPVDLIDSRKYSGITLIPLHDDPASLKIQSDSYPETDKVGGYTYSQKVSWKALQQAVKKEYGLSELDLSDLVVYIHGVPQDTDLPDSTGSLDGVPAHLTLPVACGELEEWNPQEGAGLID